MLEETKVDELELLVVIVLLVVALDEGEFEAEVNHWEL